MWKVRIQTLRFQQKHHSFYSLPPCSFWDVFSLRAFRCPVPVSCPLCAFQSVPVPAWQCRQGKYSACRLWKDWRMQLCGTVSAYIGSGYCCTSEWEDTWYIIAITLFRYQPFIILFCSGMLIVLLKFEKMLIIWRLNSDKSAGCEIHGRLRDTLFYLRILYMLLTILLWFRFDSRGSNRNKIQRF